MKYAKRFLAFVMVSLMLSASVGSSFARGHEAKAASGVEVLGGDMLFEFLLGLFGVSNILGDGGNPGKQMYQEYLDYLQSEGYAYAGEFTYEDWIDMENGNVAVLTGGLFNSFSGFLDESVGDLTSGKPQFVTGDTYFTTYGDYSTAQEISFKNYIANTVSENGYYVLVHTKQVSSHLYYSVESVQVFNPSFPFNCYIYGQSDRRVCYVSFTSDGAYISKSYVYFSTYKLITDGWSFSSRSSYFNGAEAGYCLQAYTPIPFFVVGSLNDVVSGSYSDLVSISKNVSQTDKGYVSLGSYSQAVIDSLIGKTVTSEVVNAVNTAVMDAMDANVTTNTTTGAITFTDAIAQAVSDAIAQALADAGVIEGDVTEPGTGEGEGEGEEEQKPLPWIPEIKGLLENLGDAIVDGFSKVGEWIMDIPEAIGGLFVDLWEWLQKIWEAICALPGQTADAFKDFFSPGESDAPGEGGEPPDNAPFLADLSSLFPFCVPFDLIRLFKVLQAAPQAPYWEIPLNVPSIGLEYTFVIDMSQFDSLAQIFRACETVGFICGLILITRKLIRG